MNTTPQLHHIHMLGKAYLNSPPTDIAVLDKWLVELVDKISMKLLMGPYSIDCKTLGNEGVTGVVVIETSHISAHVWHAVEKPFMMFDVYSCVAFEPNVVIEHLNQAFFFNKLSYTLIDRNNSPKIIGSEEL